MRYIGLIALCCLAGCATPLHTLRSPTGQVATCGGSVTGSLAGGVIGYHIQKGNDEDCVKNFQQQGFEEVSSYGVQ